MTKTAKTIGFVGLGNIGLGMVKNLLNADFKVIVFDIDSCKFDEISGNNLKTARSLAEVAEDCRVAITCLPHPDISEEVIFQGLLGGQGSVSTVIETSTLTPEVVSDFSDRLESMSIRFLSTPMVGGNGHALKGQIHFLAEGDESVAEDHRELFEAMGNRLDFLGKAPSATLAKTVFNLCRYSNLATAVNAYRIIEPYSPNMEAIYKFMSEQSLDNFGQVWAEDMEGTMLRNEIYKPSKVPKKDLELFAKTAKNNGVSTKLIESIKDIYESIS